MTKKVKVEWKQEVVTEIVRVKQIVMERPIQYQDNIASTQEAGRFGDNRDWRRSPGGGPSGYSGYEK